ncbi:caspase family protein [Flavihumibacter sediminis]|nr:caspase family protein [Flavihumibacter sediminis]
MRKLIIYLIFSTLIIQAQSQKIHSFLFCKTSDKKIGDPVKINYFNMQEQIQNLTEALGYQNISHIGTGRGFNARKVETEIQNADISDKDIVILYFSTHGGMSKRDSLFPQLDIPNQLVSAYNKHKFLLTKNPSLIITIIEACSGFQNITPQEAFVYGQFADFSPAEDYVPVETQNIQKLFSYKGSIIITAGNPGMDTWATANGSMFTNCFLRAINEYIRMPSNEKENVTWENVLERTKQYTWNMTSTTSSAYYPVWEIMDETNTSPVTEYGIKFNVKTKRTKRLRNKYDLNLTVVSTDNKYKIEKVVYYLHNTFIPPIVEVSDKEDDFHLYRAVWGTFPIKATVYLTNGKVVDLYKNFKFGNNN